MKERTNMGLLELENLSKVYNNVKVLDNINLSISKGESVAFSGHNGAGKSTLIKIIASLVKPTTGKVTYEQSLQFSYIPEHFPPTSLTAGEYIKSKLY